MKFIPTAASRKPRVSVRGEEAPLRQSRSSAATGEETPSLRARGNFIYRFLSRFTLILITLFVLTNIVTVSVFSSENFEVNSMVTYEVEKSGNTKVTNDINIINTKPEVYAKQYVYKLNNIQPDNIKVTEGNKSLNFKINKKDRGADIVVYFDESIIGEGGKRIFRISFTNSDLAVRTGEVWEITIPKIEGANLFNNYNITLMVPKSLGNEAYISPRPKDSKAEGEFNNYYFDKDQVAKSGISAGFGKFQVFSFSLNYHLENDSAEKKSMEIAIPPDTSLQRIHYESIDPKPENVFSDEDGNWIASYNLSSKERVDVAVKGTVQIFSSPRDFLIPPPVTLLSNTKPTEFWQSNEEVIRTLAERLKTPRKIYDYVVNTLNYDSAGVKSSAQRLGAIDALRNPQSALCMEFTDLFIAIARAAGIPAREINGFAYTENPNIQPLSLVSDVLHSWPEYWDKERNTWVSVDPTWGSTSGVDFFDKLDLRHFAFVIHGKDSVIPLPPGSHKPGNNPQKDVYVSFGQLPTNSYSKIEIKSVQARGFNLFGKKYNIEIINTGYTSEYEIDEQIIVDQVVKDRSFIQILPPFGKYEDSVSITYGLFASRAPKNILIQAGNSHLSIPIDKNGIILNQLIAISCILIFLVIMLHPKRPSIYLLFRRLRKSNS